MKKKKTISKRGPGRPAARKRAAKGRIVRRPAHLDPAMLERILAVTRELARPFDLNTLLGHVVNAGRMILGADRGSVFLYEPQTNELIASVATGLGSVRIPADRGIVGECVRTRRIVNVPDCYADPRFNREVDRETGYRTRCLLTIPLMGLDDSLVGALQLLNKRRGTFDARDETIASTLAAQCAVALQRARMMEQIVQKERLDRELAVAREIQMGFLPRAMPALEGYDLAGLSRPAEETGGDTFDLIPLGGRGLALLLGDATGHGVGPALSVTQVRAMLRIATRLGAGLEAIFRHINDQLAHDLADNRFVTAFLGVLDGEAHRVTYHAAGQAPLLHFHAAGGEVEWRGSSTMPMGMMEQMAPPAAQQIDLAPGDILGLFTDGLFEAEDSAGKAFGEQSVARLIREHRDDPMQGVASTLMQSVRRHSGSVPQADDITILLVRRMPARSGRHG